MFRLLMHSLEKECKRTRIRYPIESTTLLGKRDAFSWTQMRTSSNWRSVRWRGFFHQLSSQSVEEFRQLYVVFWGPVGH
jgi:hypothetical protein